MPVPFWFSVPVPEMMPDSVCVFALMPFTAPLSITAFTNVSLFARLIASVAPKFTVVEAVFAMDEPTVAPLPICSVPKATVVAPVYVFAFVSTVVPVPCWRSVPVPLIRLPTEIASPRLKMSAPLSVTPAPPSVPVTPPLPTCSVPPRLIEVVPP